VIEKIYIYESSSTDPYRNIATEKYLLEQGGNDCCILYLWQNAHTVVIGRNQNAWSECRTALLTEEGGKLARRLSGGGAVYHDMGNLNFTFLVADGDYDVDRQLSVIQTACIRLGIPVERSGRNDLLAEGKKFSGNAFYHSKGRAYHHGTLLVDADTEKLSRYLTPPKAKLEAKGVASVRSRVTNLKELCPTLTIPILKEQLKLAFGEVYGFTPDVFTLNRRAEAVIAQDAVTLSGWDWLYGQRLPFSLSCEEYFPWGYLQLLLQVESGVISGAEVYTDAMDWSISDQLQKALLGCRLEKAALKDALAAVSAGQDVYRLLEKQTL